MQTLAVIAVCIAIPIIAAWLFGRGAALSEWTGAMADLENETPIEKGPTCP
jgi:hypothetical protein